MYDAGWFLISEKALAIFKANTVRKRKESFSKLIEGRKNAPLAIFGIDQALVDDVWFALFPNFLKASKILFLLLKNRCTMPSSMNPM